jgi:hypothetical protein
MFGEEDTLQDDQQLDVDQQDVDNADGGDEQQDDYFLEVNERQKYKTREDVLKAMNEAGTRISSLSVWEKIAKEFGGLTPDATKKLLLELVDRREKESKGSQQQDNKQGASKDDTQSDEDLTPQEKKALKWLQKQAPKLGFVPKDEILKLQKQVEDMGKSFKSLDTQRQEERLESLVSKGRSQVNELLKAAKLPSDNKEFMEDLEDFIAAYVNKSEERVNAFYGSPEDNQAIVKEAFDRAMKSFNLVKAKANTSYVNSKNNVVNKNVKKLPPNGTRAGDERLANKAKRGITPSVHDKAWAIMQQTLHGDSAE